MKRFSAFALLTLVILFAAAPVLAQESGTSGVKWNTITAGFAMAIASSSPVSPVQQRGGQWAPRSPEGILGGVTPARRA